MKIIVPRSLSRIEKLQVSRYRTLRDQIHQGPLYTVLGDNGRISKQGGKLSKAQIDPFNGVQTYTMKYRRQTRRIPRLDGRPYGSLIPSMFETWIYQKESYESLIIGICYRTVILSQGTLVSFRSHTFKNKYQWFVYQKKKEASTRKVHRLPRY